MSGWTVRRAAVVAGLVVFGWALLAVPARAGLSRTTADEPQYLLTALSLWEDRDLDIRDELRDARYVSFHEEPLPEQTKLLPDGRRVSPHDPLLPVLLAVPVGLGGWAGAKVAMAALAGLLAAALVWVAGRRFGVEPARAALVVTAFGVAPPLTAYATQVYPELPAALLATVALGAILAPRDPPRLRGPVVVAAAAVVTLPWLSVKYAPVAAVLGIALLHRAWSGGRRTGALTAAFLGANGVVFLWAHRVLYGGWTAYAAGDHFVGGELTVAGVSPDYVARAPRLVGLLVDKWFGLAAWSPLYLLVVVAFAAMLRRREPGGALLGAVLAAAWLNASFVAYTMHGWWWPGRQVVVALPAAVLAVAWWTTRVRRTTVLAVVLPAAAFSLATWAWLLAHAASGEATLITGFERGSPPWLSLWQLALPDGQVAGPRDVALLVAWLVAIGALAASGALGARRPVRSPPCTPARRPPAGRSAR